MNQDRRKRIQEAIEILEAVKEEEEEVRENVPENLYYSERAEQMEENVNAIEEAIGYLEEIEGIQ